MIFQIITMLIGGFWNLRKLCNYKNSLVIRIFARVLYRRYCTYLNSSIGYNTIFLGKALFPHNIHGVFISGEAIIGKNAVIFQNVTIGSNTIFDSKRFGAPTIGENCFIGANAVIIGKIDIGNNVRVGANSTVYTDVPDNSIVIGNNIIKRKSKELNNRYYIFSKSKLAYFDDGKWIEESNAEIEQQFHKFMVNK